MPETLKAQPLSRPRTAHKGFSLVELVIAILIIAVLVAAVFAGGSIIIKNAQISRTTSDLHNFSIAVESWMNQNPTIANVRNNESYKKDTALYNSFNALLAEDYKLEDVANTSNIIAVQAADGGDYYIYRSKKTDAWGNAYYVVFTDQERSDLEGNKHSEFFVEVISAGPNAKTKIGGAEDKIDGDDIFLVGQYTDGNVVSKIYNYDDDKPVNDSGVAATSYTTNSKASVVTKGTTITAVPTVTPSIPVYNGTDLTGTTWEFPFDKYYDCTILWNNSNHTWYLNALVDGYFEDGEYIGTEENNFVLSGNFLGIYDLYIGNFNWLTGGSSLDDFTFVSPSGYYMKITGGTDATNPTVIAWFEANATRIS